MALVPPVLRMLQVINWFVALGGEILPDKFSGVPAVAVKGKSVMFVTGTKFAFTVTEKSFA